MSTKFLNLHLSYIFRLEFTNLQINRNHPMKASMEKEHIHFIFFAIEW